MALPTPEEVLNKKKGLPTPSDILVGKQNGLPTPDQILQTPKSRPMSEEVKQTAGFQALSTGDSLLNTFKKNNPNAIPENPKPIDDRNKVEKTLDYIFQENPVMRVFNYPFAKAAEGSIPDAPLIKDGQNVPGSSARELHAQMNPVMSTGNETLDKVGNIAAIPLSFAVNPSNVQQNLVAGGYGVANRLLNTKLGQRVENLAGRAGAAIANRINPVLNTQGLNISTNLAEKAGRGFTRGAIAGGVAEGAHALQTTGGTARDVARGAIEGAAFGGLGDGLVNALSEPIQRAFRSWMKRGDAPPQVQEILALPEAQTQPQRGNPNRVQTPDVINAQAAPTTARTGQRVNPHRKKWESLVAEAHNMQFTPGRELEELESLWSQRAAPNDPSLNELIELAYPRQRNLSPDALQRGRMAQSAGAGPNVESNVMRRPFRTQPEQPRVTSEPPVRAQEPPRSEVNTPPVQETPRKQPVRLSELSDTGMKERGFTTTLKDSPKVQEGLRDRLSNLYKPITNEEAVARANKRVAQNVEEAVDFVTRSRVLNAEHVATAHRLIDEFQKQGNFERAVDIADRIAELGTKAGQSIQAFSIYNRLTPEGILVHANRLASKVNERLPRGMKEVKVTPEVAAQLTDLATTTQKMTGVASAANDVMDILEKAKKGEKLNELETQTIKRFVNEAKQFVKETKGAKLKMPRPPKELNDKRVRDKVVSFLEAQEKAAKDRLKAKGIQISSMPLDIYADYAIIGATKLARGTIKFADWSEEMVTEFGEQIRPVLADIYNKAQETLSLSTKKITSETISRAEKLAEKAIQRGNLVDAEAESIRALAQRVSGLSGDAKRYASQDLQAILNHIDKPTVLQKVSSFQTMMQLLNPKTLLTRNPLGNEMFYRLERLTKYVAAPIDWTRVKIFGGQRSVTFRTNNQGQYWEHWIKGAVAGWKGVNPEGLTTQYDIRSPAFSHKWNPLTYMEKALGASLKSFDYASYKRAVNKTIGEMATLRAMNEGLKGEARKAAIQKYIRETDENILKIADEYGKYVTFQDNNVISVGLQKFKRGLNFGKDFGVGDLVLKYPRTPGALVMRALEYSPVGFLRSLKIAFNPFFKKDPNTQEAVMAVTRAAIGTLGLSGMGYFFLDKGILTGAASKDRDVRDLQRQAGQGQYQVNVSAFMRYVKSGFDPDEASLREGDFLYTYDWAQPVAIAVSMGANMKKNINDVEAEKGEKLNLVGAAYRSAEGGLNTIVEQSVLSGIKRAAQGYYGQSVMDKVVDILADVPASFTPTLSNQINQFSDNTRRETYAPNKFDESMNRVKARIPGLAQTLPQEYDTLGNPKQVMQSNNWFNVFLNPGYASRYKLTPEAKFVVELINETGDLSVAPRVPGKTLNVKLPGSRESESQKLTTEQYARLQQILGQETSERLMRINPNASQEAQLRQAAKALNEAGERARKEIKREMGVR